MRARWGFAALLLAGSAAAEPTLSLHDPDGRALANGASIDAETRLRFTVAGDPDQYLYVVESAEGSVMVVYPPMGRFLTGRDGPVTLDPQASWPGGLEGQPVDWVPQASGALEYLLVQAPTPRDAPVGGRLDGLDELLAPPPYVTGPAGEPAQVVARVTLSREESEAPPDEAPEPPDEPELGGEEEAE